MPYPVSVRVEPLLRPRDRMTTAFRLILAIPHLFLVGGIGFSMVFRTGRDDIISLGPETGVLGFVAGHPRHRQLVHDPDQPRAHRRHPRTTRASTCAGACARSRI